MSKKEGEELFKFVQAHHFGYGEKLSFNCPHCGNEVVMEFKALEPDPDTIEVYWGKNYEEIEAKKKKVEEAEES